MSKNLKRSVRIASAAAIVVAGSIAAVGVSTTANADTTATAAQKPTVVLVHGAWADSASFGSIGTRLRNDGYTVRDFANPLRSLSGDAADLNSFLKVETSGPVILVGHSYGGAVVTQAAATDPQVKGLVYVDAFAPAAGESVLSLAATASTGDPSAAFDKVPYTGAPAGDAELYLKHDAFTTTLANGLPKQEQEELYSRQEPVTYSALNEKATAAAWKTIPSWYVAGTQDKSIPLPLQEKMATRAHSHLTTVNSGHLSMLRHPGTITHVIEQAATSTR